MDNNQIVNQKRVIDGVLLIDRVEPTSGPAKMAEFIGLKSGVHVTVRRGPNGRPVEASRNRPDLMRVYPGCTRLTDAEFSAYNRIKYGIFSNR